MEARPPSPPPEEALPPGASLLELAKQTPPPSVQEALGSYLHSAELLGLRTAELHLALAAAKEKDFAPEPFTKLYQRSIYQTMRSEARQTLSLLRKRASSLPANAADLAGEVLQNEASVLAKYQSIAQRAVSARRIRCHGDLHLGQTLFTGRDFLIIDFEGEPDRPISERRIKTSPLRDVAGMLRSFHYAPHAAKRLPPHDSLLPSATSQDIQPWLTVWYLWSAAAFLRAYLAQAEQGGFLPSHPEERDLLLRAYLLRKALYELRYELNNRPGWVAIPIEGVLHVLKAH